MNRAMNVGPHVVFTLICGFFLFNSRLPAMGAVVGGWDLARGGIGSIADSPSNALFRSLLQANFPGTTFSGTGTLTPAYLATIDVLVLGAQTADSPNPGFVAPLTAAEQQALFGFVQGGGGVFLSLERDPQGGAGGAAARETFIDAFGMDITGDLLSPTANIVAPNHPIFDGPFGTVAGPLSLGASAYFDDLGPYAHTLATDSVLGLPVLAAIEHCALGPMSGPVIILADANLLDPRPYVPVLVTNATSYLLTDVVCPEPSTWLLALLGAAGVLLSGSRRRARQPRP